MPLLSICGRPFDGSGMLEGFYEKAVSKGENSGLDSLLSSRRAAGVATPGGKVGIRGKYETGRDHAEDRSARAERARRLYLRNRRARRGLGHRSFDYYRSPQRSGSSDYCCGAAVQRSEQFSADLPARERIITVL